MVNFTTRKEAKLDNILTSNWQYYHETEAVENLGCSDHKSVLMRPKLKHKKKICKKIIIEDKRDQFKKSLFEKFQNINWTQMTNEPNVNKQVTTLYQTIENLMMECIPKRTITITNKDPPWVTPLIKDVLNQKHKASKAGNHNKVKALAKKVEKLAQKSKINVLKDERFENQKGSAKWWKLVNKSKVNNKCMNKFLESFDSLENAANNINDFFVNICTSQLPLEEQEWKCAIPTEPIPEWQLPTELETFQLLHKIKTRKSGCHFPSWLWQEKCHLSLHTHHRNLEK